MSLVEYNSNYVVFNFTRKQPSGFEPCMYWGSTAWYLAFLFHLKISKAL